MIARKSKYFLTFILLAALLAGCNNNASTAPTASTVAAPSTQASSTPAPTTIDSGNRVKIAQWSAPSGLFHPDLLSGSYDSSVTSLIFESLVDFAPGLVPEGTLAKSWEISADNLSVTFNLVETNWHDGTPFTAEDVKFSLEFVGHPDYTGPRYSNVEKILGMKEFHAGEADSVIGIEIINDHEIKITTEEILAPFLYHIGGRPIMPKHIWENVEVKTAAENRDVLLNPIGTGPFIYKDYVPDSHVTLDANPNYHGGAPKVEGIIIMTVNQDTAQAQLIRGEIDMISVSDFNPEAMKIYQDAGIIVQTVNTVTAQYMGVNNRMEDFAKKEVRKGLAHAIQRQEIVDNLLYGEASVLNNPFTKVIWACPDETELQQYEYDTEKAIAYFEEAGYSYDKANNVMKKPDGTPVKWTLSYSTGNKARELSASVIQSNLKDIGITLDLDLMDFNQLSDKCKAADFEFMLMGMGTSFDADQKYIWETDASYNYAGWTDEYSDQLLDEGMKYIDIEKRKEIYKEWALYMNDNIPNVWLYNPNGGLAFTPKLQNVNYTTVGSYYQIEKWEFAK